MAVRKGGRQKKKRAVDVERKRETERGGIESGERAKSSERRRKHASLAGTHVETSSAAGLAGALSGVRSGLDEGGGGRPAVSRFYSGRVCAALSRPKARPPKPRGAYFTNDRPPRSIHPSVSVHTHTYALTRARAYDPSELRRDAGEKETTRGRLILARPAAQVPPEK